MRSCAAWPQSPAAYCALRAFASRVRSPISSSAIGPNRRAAPATGPAQRAVDLLRTSCPPGRHLPGPARWFPATTSRESPLQRQSLLAPNYAPRTPRRAAVSATAARAVADRCLRTLQLQHGRLVQAVQRDCGGTPQAGPACRRRHPAPRLATPAARSSGTSRREQIPANSTNHTIQRDICL